MEVTSLLAVFFALTFAASNAKEIPDQIHPLRPQSGAAGRKIPGVHCLSWRLAVETDNIRNWDVVPQVCENYVGHYMLGGQYRMDCYAAAAAAYEYAKSLTLGKDGKDVWIFDVDETALSNLPYYARPDNAFGAKEYNETTFQEWEKEGKAPAVPAVLDLYKKLLKLGFKIVFISGKAESLRKITTQNMHNVGYHTWEKLVLKSAEEKAESLKAYQYKSRERTKLVKKGYRILGNLGDQWSDIIGAHVGNRTFKLPNPMFYIA
ncbi:acid phosphatase 1-like [Punica granatum]|uniref:Uncharacterized protein n=2 Tax=Punica granatum TaxID=22663 RepID=A0A218WV27_PUNGR|nr:acid phosphatase 1-like [Punica granatum]OWM76523.1 hypothetical protein CDL15_Pgr005487 [Punica granatum]PKI70994.1 hypothetical protein CRG98_008575 [Punica granatum]